jgi:hypothetical protein
LSTCWSENNCRAFARAGSVRTEPALVCPWLKKLSFFRDQTPLGLDRIFQFDRKML